MLISAAARRQMFGCCGPTPGRGALAWGQLDQHDVRVLRTRSNRSACRPATHRNGEATRLAARPSTAAGVRSRGRTTRNPGAGIHRASSPAACRREEIGSCRPRDRPRRPATDGSTVRRDGLHRHASCPWGSGVQDELAVGRPDRIGRQRIHQPHRRAAVGGDLEDANALAIHRGDRDPFAIRRPRRRTSHIERLGQRPRAGSPADVHVSVDRPAAAPGSTPRLPSGDTATAPATAPSRLSRPRSRPAGEPPHGVGSAARCEIERDASGAKRGAADRAVGSGTGWPLARPQHHP